jgi:hypothetical protein
VVLKQAVVVFPFTICLGRDLVKNFTNSSYFRATERMLMLLRWIRVTENEADIVQFGFMTPLDWAKKEILFPSPVAVANTAQIPPPEQFCLKITKISCTDILSGIFLDSCLLKLSEISRRQVTFRLLSSPQRVSSVAPFHGSLPYQSFLLPVRPPSPNPCPEKSKETSLQFFLNDTKTTHKLKTMKDTAFPLWDQLDLQLYVVCRRRGNMEGDEEEGRSGEGRKDEKRKDENGRMKRKDWQTEQQVVERLGD